MKLAEALKKHDNLLIDFFADDCPPCHIQKDILIRLKEQEPNLFTIIQVDRIKNPEVFKAFEINKLPHLKFFRNGKPIWQKSGILGIEELMSLLKK